MSFENRLKRGLEAQTAGMEEDVTTALKHVREKGARRRRMQFAGAALAAAAIFATGAMAGPSILEAMRGTEPDGGTDIAGPNEKPSPGPSQAPTPTTTPTPPPPEVGAIAMPVWFTSGEMLQTTTRFVTDADPEAQAEELLAELFGEPNAAEAENGLGTAIPSGTRLLNNYINGKQPTIDLSAEFEGPSDGDGIGQRVAQVVWTLNDLVPDGVVITVEGEPLDLPGLGVQAPYTTDEFESLLLPITVWSPYTGQEIDGPSIHIEGTANVFEATVTIRIVDGQGHSILMNRKGKVIEETFTTATCGTGCRGTYEIDVPIQLGPEEATVIVYEVSAENGEPIHLVSIPVVLEPSADGD